MSTLAFARVKTVLKVSEPIKDAAQTPGVIRLPENLVLDKDQR